MNKLFWYQFGLRFIILFIGVNWDFSCDLLFSHLGLSRFHLELLNMNRSKKVILNQPFTNQDRVPKVISLGHKGNQNITTQCQLTTLRCSPIGDYLTGFDSLPRVNQRFFGECKCRYWNVGSFAVDRCRIPFRRKIVRHLQHALFRRFGQ